MELRSRTPSSGPPLPNRVFAKYMRYNISGGIDATIDIRGASKLREVFVTEI